MLEMSAFVRSQSMMMEPEAQRGGDASFVRVTNDANVSPLQIFVQAKKNINDIFIRIEAYADETASYIREIPMDQAVVSECERKEISDFSKKVLGIRDVLARDHMKVAFFGRTSNGKSTVINAMLKDKILPSGIGHTTSCFLQVEGSDTPGEGYLISEESAERKNITTVKQLANALSEEKLPDSALVRVFWPKEKCPLLRDDVVFVDSPGIDVSPNLDEWIDKHCLDADVFVLVANSESTLMVTEKNFFHKVSTRLSKPNIFILNNRWDASASEPEFLDQVRAQHLERTSDFLVKELKVVTKEQVGERVFFISAKEVLQARLAEQSGSPLQTGAFPEGFAKRCFEFQDFERKFEECISKSAVRTKFEQHSHRGKHIAKETMSMMENIFSSTQKLRADKTMGRKELWDKIDFTDKQLQLLTQEMKEKIRHMVEDVECRVSKALSEEIRRLSELVEEFAAPFHPDNLVLNVYKKELHSHVEAGLGSNLRARLSSCVAMNMENHQKEMTERMFALLPPDKRNLTAGLLPRREPFEVLYRLNCDNLCGDFKEDITFRFTFGMQALLKRFFGHVSSKPRKSFPDQIPRGLPPVPQQQPLTPLTPTNDPTTSFFNGNNDDWSLLSRIAVASITSQGTMGGLLVAGFLLKTVGWRVIAITGMAYGGLYLYHRLTWTNKAKEREFKRQYVDHATRKLKMIVDLTSANCSHQVQQELSSTFARLCHLVDSSTSEMEQEMKQLEHEILGLEELASQAKVLKNKGGYLINELNMFDKAYLNGKS